jgi:hypothetical protein
MIDVLTGETRGKRGKREKQKTSGDPRGTETVGSEDNGE